MTGKITQSIKLYLRQEKGSDRWQRMWVCAVVGILLTTIFAWTMSTINQITLPYLHLGMDWNRLWFYWGGLCLVAGIEGLFVGWFTEHYEGISYGWIPVELLLLLGYLIKQVFDKTDPFTASLSTMGILEVTGVLILLAIILRMTANKFIMIYDSDDKIGRRNRTSLLTAIIILLMIMIGGLNHFDIPLIKALDSFNNSMELATTDSSHESWLPLDKIPELRSHLGKPYKMYPRPDTEVVGNYVINVAYIDGFSFSCKVSMTGSVKNFYFFDWKKGIDLAFP